MTQSRFVYQVCTAALQIKYKSQYPVESDISAPRGKCKSFVPVPEFAKLLKINMRCVMRRSPFTGSQRRSGEYEAKISDSTVLLDDESGFL
jgi:hypothetical protein